MSHFEATLQSLFRKTGIAIGRYRPPAHRRTRLFAKHGVTTVVDVGANTGQYGCELRKSGFSGRIVSFEPLSDAYAQLAKNVVGDPRWEAFNLGASDCARTARLNVASNSASSSLLAMTDTHLEAAPWSEFMSMEDVELVRLEHVIELSDSTCLKLDVQGHELEALDGATALLKFVEVIEIECSIDELYAGQPVLVDVLNRLAKLGYRLKLLEPGFHDSRTGAILQFDGFFVRSTKP